MAFTAEELAAMRLADEEIEDSFALTEEEVAESKLLDREAEEEGLTPKQIKNRRRCREYYQNNKERMNEASRAYHWEHRDEILAQKREKYQANIEYERQNRRDRHLANPEKRRAKDREYYQRNREAVLARNKRSRERAKARTQKAE